MSNYGIVNNIRTRGNGRAPVLDWAAAGFDQVDWNKYTYTFGGEGERENGSKAKASCSFPTFTIKPGLIPHEFGAQSGLVAECAAADVRLCFKYGTEPAIIKAELDDAILEIMRLNAEVDDCSPLDWGEWEADGLVIDFDDFMEDGRWVRS